MTWARKITERREQRIAEREANFRALAMPPRTIHKGTYTGTTTAAAPKSQAYRDDALLEMAKDRPCLLMLPATCNHRTDTTVACHSNLSVHGKSAHRKADEHYSVWGCSACHFWLDFGKADADRKKAVFMLAHARQVLAWRLIAQDSSEPERFRQAARRALERLNATPITEEP